MKGPWERSQGTVEHEITITAHELTTALGNIICDDFFADLSLGIFIDGLDELREPSLLDTMDLVKQLCEWAPATQNRVKICVASRVQSPFMDLFDADNRFLLHEITRYDMERFVQSRLPEGRESIPPSVRDDLIRTIPWKAEGVFLWVDLVVKNIRQELSGGVIFDGNSDILTTFPSGLENLIDSILVAVPKRWINQLHQTFKVLHVMQRKDPLPLSLLAYSFFDDFEEDPRFALQDWFQGQHDRNADTWAHLEKAKAKLLHRSGNLLEVHDHMFSLPDVKVIHRSVREYLESKDACLDFDAIDCASYLMLGELVWLSNIDRCGSEEEKRRNSLCGSIYRFRCKSKRDHPPYEFLDYLQTVTEGILNNEFHRSEAGEFDHPSYRKYGWGSSGGHALRFRFPQDPTPLHANISSGQCDYAIYRLIANFPVGFPTFMLLMTIIVTELCVGDIELSKKEKVFLDLFFIRTQEHHNTRTEMIPLHSQCWKIWNVPKGTSLSAWHGFLVAEFLTRLSRPNGSLLKRSRTPDAIYGVVLEGFLLSGVDPNIWIDVTPETPVDELERDRVWKDSMAIVQFRFGPSNQKVVFQEALREMDFDMSYGKGTMSEPCLLVDGWSLRDWIEKMHDLPNKRRILRLMDYGTPVIILTRLMTAARVFVPYLFCSSPLPAPDRLTIY